MEDQNKNQVILLAERLTGSPNENTFEIKNTEWPKISGGEVLLKTLYLSVDPGMRGFMKKGTHDDIGNKFEIGKPIISRTVAQVMESKSEKFTKGTIVHGRLSWQKYQTISAENLDELNPDFGPISTAVNILGVSGLTAYFGLTKIGDIKKDKLF